MENQPDKWYNRYSGTLSFFLVALFATLNSAYFPYTIVGKLCGLFWLFSFTLVMFAGEYMLNHVEFKGEMRYLKATVMLGVWFLGLVALVLFALILNK
ncbi:hypothetical protein EQ500_01970 [Lactobacillus sp. XV13L]|nr:hypothetical protein [Lactobacillus sp. XV13L]